jgi:NADP-dependent 3-hydroxy acid dehydrogenase YdfG
MARFADSGPRASPQQQGSAALRMSILADKKVAVVTGGGKGLGKTLTRYLLENEMKVAICSRNQDTIANTVAELSNEFPGKIIG